MQVIAHRGACQEALENSWQAFRKAIELGADRIELDVQLTRDHELVIIHDDTLSRVSHQQGTIHQMTRKELSKVCLRNEEPLPFLDEVIQDLLPKIELNIEIKPAGPEIIERTMQLLKKSALAQRAVISSFHQATVLHLSRHYPDQRVAYLWCRTWPWQINQRPQTVIPKLTTPIIHPDARLVTPRFMNQARQKGWQVFPYVSLDHEKNPRFLWQHLHDMQVEGLCTNYPREMIAWLKEKEIASYAASST